MLLAADLVTRGVNTMPLTNMTDMSFQRSTMGRAFGYGEFILEPTAQDQALRKLDDLLLEPGLPRTPALGRLPCVRTRQAAEAGAYSASAACARATVNTAPATASAIRNKALIHSMTCWLTAIPVAHQVAKCSQLLPVRL